VVHSQFTEHIHTYPCAEATMGEDGLYDGRASYSFVEDELDLIYLDKLWFVQRDSFDNAIQKKKKSFRVIWPPCSFDSVMTGTFHMPSLTKEDSQCQQSQSMMV